MFDTRRL